MVLTHMDNHIMAKIKVDIDALMIIINPHTPVFITSVSHNTNHPKTQHKSGETDIVML